MLPQLVPHRDYSGLGSSKAFACEQNTQSLRSTDHLQDSSDRCRQSSESHRTSPSDQIDPVSFNAVTQWPRIDQVSLAPRNASFLPSDFFGDDEEPPFRLLIAFGQLLSSFERLRTLTLPFPDRVAVFSMLSAPPSLTSLLLTHAQPSTSIINLIADTCPGLEELFFGRIFFTVRKYNK